MDLGLPNLWTNVHVDQSGRAGASHETARPIVIKVLLVAPNHLKPGTTRFFPDEPVIKMPFPGRRMTAQEVEFERRWPAQQAASRFAAWPCRPDQASKRTTRPRARARSFGRPPGEQNGAAHRSSLRTESRCYPLLPCTHRQIVDQQHPVIRICYPELRNRTRLNFHGVKTVEQQGKRSCSRHPKSEERDEAKKPDRAAKQESAHLLDSLGVRRHRSSPHLWSLSVHATLLG